MNSLRVFALTAALAVAPSLAQAQEDTSQRVAPTEASSTGKGIVGGALLGAEAVMLVEAAAGVRPVWPYIVGGSIGAIGGGVGGFFAEDAEPRVSLYLLAGGMTLIIPTTIAVLSRTSYNPPADYTEDRPPIDEPVAEPPQPTSAVPASPQSETAATRPKAAKARRTTKRSMPKPVVLRPPPALIGVDEGLLSLSVPAVEVRDAYSRTEVAIYGVQQRTELRLPVLNVVF